MDSLLSIVQMPGGIPVGTLAIGKSGATNAAILAASILSSSGNYPEIAKALDEFRTKQTDSVAQVPVDITTSTPTPSISSISIIHPVQQIIQNAVHIESKTVFEEKMLPPGSTIGIVGGGQLAKMIIQSASQLGYKCHVYCPDEASPAFQIATKSTIANYEDKTHLQQFAKQVDVVTYEFENVPSGTIEHISQFVPVRPKVDVLKISQHRILEKSFCQKIQIPTTKFLQVNSASEIETAVNQINVPCILKSSTFGYDGKGQVLIKTKENLQEYWKVIEQVKSDSGILEAFVNFKMEVSVIIARGYEEGSSIHSIKTFPVVENRHEHHILKETHVPAPISPKLQEEAQAIAKRIAEEIDLVGLLAIEMFVTNDEKILVNETAPRPHNSGHWSIEGATTSQFEQLIRCICGLPLGETTPRAPKVVMKNLLGDEIHKWKDYLKEPNSHLHVYGKSEVKPGRKMGHVTSLIYN